MDPFLADYYGTGQGAGYDEDALEKMAQLTLLTKEAEEEGIDLSELSEEELLALSEEVYGGDEDPMEKEASDMFETFDFGGRVMAHSMWNELEAIQKQAAKAGRGTMEEGSSFANVVGRKAKEKAPGKSMTFRELGRKIKGAPGRAAESVGRAVTPTFIKRRLAARSASIGPRYAKYLKGIGGATMGLGAAGLTAGGIYAAKKRKEKKSSDSAFDALVEQRAMEHLYASGYMDDQGNVYGPEVEKTAGDFDEYVNDAALQYLSELGYPVE